MQEIVNSLKDRLMGFAPSGWTRIIVYAELSEDLCETRFYFAVPKRKYIQCYELCKKGVAEEAIDQALDAIRDLLFPLWEKNRKDSPWTNCTIVAYTDGTFSADYDNTNLDEGSYEYRKIWTNKYLK